MKRVAKTTTIELLNGVMRRIVKSEVDCIHEQTNIMGGVDTEVFMRSGTCYLTKLTKAEVESKIYG